MNPIYRFFLKKDSDTRRVAHPIYSGDLSLDWEKENDEQFFRRKLSGKLTFVGSDYEYIMPSASAYGNTFIVYIEISYDGGVNWSEYWQGVFYHTDCEIDIDNKFVAVTPTVQDNYKDIIAGLDNEYNMIDLQPPIFQIYMQKRPIIQITYTDSNKVTCYKADGTYWEQDIQPQIQMRTMYETYHFFLNNSLMELKMIPVAGTGTILTNIPQNLKTMFIGHTGSNPTQIWARYNDGTYIYEYNFTTLNFTIFAIATGTAIYHDSFTQYYEHTIHAASGTGYADLKVTVSTIQHIWGRIITDENLPNSFPIPSNDIVANNYNYSRCMLFNGQGTIYYTDTFSSTPTKWGLHGINEYYKTPPTGYYDVLRWLPISMSEWTQEAYWFGWSASYIPLDESGRTQVLLRNAYFLPDVINGILSKIAPNISVYDYSFLGGPDPLTNIERYFFITPKSNMKNLNYDMPAMNAPITLKSIFDMLRQCYNCYWHIENNKLHINHLKYYENGGSYNSSHLQIGFDLTAHSNTRNGKQLDFGQNKIIFDKPDMTSRFEFGWMDNETTPFNGEPMTILAPYVNKDKVDKITVSQFSSDVDYIIMNPNDISDDGFVLMVAVISGGVFTLPFSTFADMDDVNLQNAYCAFVYLQNNYLSYGLPALKYKLGDREREWTAKSVARMKNQDVSFPCLQDLDINKLIKTSIGNGQIEKLTINLSSRNGKATLKFEAQ